MTPEARARQTIDALLLASGWHVCDVADVPEIGVVVEVDRHLSIVREVGADCDANLKRAQTLQQATLSKEFLSR